MFGGKIREIEVVCYEYIECCVLFYSDFGVVVVGNEVLFDG